MAQELPKGYEEKIFEFLSSDARLKKKGFRVVKPEKALKGHQYAIARGGWSLILEGARSSDALSVILKVEVHAGFDVLRHEYNRAKQVPEEAARVLAPLYYHRYRSESKSAGLDHEFSVLIYKKLNGPSLEHWAQEAKFQEPDGELWSTIVRGCLAALRELHALGIVHRDVKPENFMLHYVPDHPPEVYLVDLGSAQSLETLAKNKQMKYKEKVGSEYFMSLDAEKKLAQSYAQDMESLSFSLWWLLKGDQVPWDKAKARQRVTMKETLTKAPEPVRTAVEACRAVDFGQTPDYDLLSDVLRSLVASSPDRSGSSGKKRAKEGDERPNRKKRAKKGNELEQDGLEEGKRSAQSPLRRRGGKKKANEEEKEEEEVRRLEEQPQQGSKKPRKQEAKKESRRSLSPPTTRSRSRSRSQPQHAQHLALSHSPARASRSSSRRERPQDNALLAVSSALHALRPSSFSLPAELLSSADGPTSQTRAKSSSPPPPLPTAPSAISSTVASAAPQQPQPVLAAAHGSTCQHCGSGRGSASHESERNDSESRPQPRRCRACSCLSLVTCAHPSSLFVGILIGVLSTLIFF